MSLVRKPRMVAWLASLLFVLPAFLPAFLAAIEARRRAATVGRLGAVFVRLPLVFRAFLAFAAVALFGFFMGILLNEGLRGFTKTG